MIGSSIAIRLRQLGADITILDAELPMYGANKFNLEPIRGQVKMVKADIRDRRSLEQLKWDFDMIFNLAGQVSHNDSIENPYLDTEINYLGQLNVLEQARKKNPKARIFFPVHGCNSARSRPFPLRKTTLSIPSRPMR